MEKTNLSQKELDGIYTFAIDLTRRAGKLLLDAAEKRYGDAEDRSAEDAHVEKENAVDLVTKMDEGRNPCRLAWSSTFPWDAFVAQTTDLELFVF